MNLLTTASASLLDKKKAPPPGSYSPFPFGTKGAGEGTASSPPTPAPPTPLLASLELLCQRLLGDILSYKEMNATHSTMADIRRYIYIYYKIIYIKYIYFKRFSSQFLKAEHGIKLIPIMYLNDRIHNRTISIHNE